MAKGVEKGFASTTDMAEKKITFSEIGTDLYAFTAEGDPNSAVIVGDDGCLVFDAQATGGSVVAADKNLDITDQVIARLRTMAPGAPVASTKPGATKPATGPTAGPSGVSRPKSPSQ